MGRIGFLRQFRALAGGLRRAATRGPEGPSSEVFDRWAADGRAVEMERHHAPVVRRLFERLSLPSDGWFLDVGCGDGYAVRWAAEAVPKGRAIGVDASPAMVTLARNLSPGLANVEFQVGAFPDCALPRGRFDVVLAVEALYYLRDLARGLEAIRDLLKPGGVLVSAVDFYWEHLESHGWREYVGTPMHLLTARGWRRAFARAGFRPVRQERLVLPASSAVERWHATEGSLVTWGTRPAV